MNCNLFALRRVSRAALSGLCALPLLIGVFNTASAQIITTVAGTSDVTGRPARSISVQPWGLATAPDGSLYVADSNHAQILRFDPVAQVFTVVAGTTGVGYSGDGGPAISAQLNLPVGLAFDATGNLYIADAGNGRIRKVSAATGEISTVAGGGTSTADGEQATNAFFQDPRGIAVGPDGSIYIADYEDHRVRRVVPNIGLIFTVAGTGEPGYSGDDGPAALAQVAHPSAVALDTLGNVYIADEANFRIRVINATTGIIKRFAGTGEFFADAIDGLPALETPMTIVSALQFDAQGNLFFTDLFAQRVRKISAGTTLVSTVAGGGYELEGVPATSGRIDMPQGFALASNGDIYVSSQNRYLLQRVSGVTGMLEVVAGNGLLHDSGDGGPALLAQISPRGTIPKPNGDLLVLDYTRIRDVGGVTGILATIAGQSEGGTTANGFPARDAYLNWPSGMVSDSSGNLFLDEMSGGIWKITAATGIINRYTGSCCGTSGNGGLAINAKMMGVFDMATDAADNLYLLGREGGIRKINAATGIITSIAGNGNTTGPWGDGQLATNVALGYLTAIAIDDQANIYLVHYGRVRRIDAVTGIITTIAGTGAWADTGDGGPALSASLIADDIALDAAGNIFLTAEISHRVRKIDKATGIISTVAGQGIAGYAGDGGIATAALLNEPHRLSFDGQGNLYVSEKYHVRRIAGIGALPPPPPPADTTPPIVVPTLTGTKGSAQGWYITNVGVRWTLIEPESSIATTSGCAESSVASDGVFTMTCTATSGGGTTTQSVTFKRDATPPTIVFGAPTPAPNAAGWNKTDVSTPWTKSDNLSGVMGSATGAIASTAQGVNIQWSMGFSDIAGNWGEGITPGVNIDKTAPTVTVTSPVNGASYPVGTAVLASYACSDSLSGISTCLGTAPNGNAIDTATAGTKTFLVTVTDLAGNVATESRSYTVSSSAPPPPPPPPPPTPTYCASRGTTSNWEWIRSLKFGSWTNTSNNNGGYGNFTANAPISLQRGSNNIVLTPGFSPVSSYTENWRVWIDYDKDGTFAASEQVFAIATSQVMTTSFIVPSFAPSGTTRMRVSMKYGGAPTPCETFTYGEVEDYRITIP